VVSQLVLARTMQLDSFGVYATIIAWTTVLSLFGGFGMPLAAVRFLPVYRAREEWEAFRGFLHVACGLGVLSSVAIGIGFVLFFLSVPSFRPVATAAMAGAPLILLLCLTALGVVSLQAMQLPLRAEALPNLVRPLLVALVVGGTGRLAGPPDAPLALALTAVATLLVMVTTLVALKRVLPANLPKGRSLAAEPAWITSGLAFLVSGAAMSLIERVDTILVSALIGPAEAGIYSVASRLALMVGFALSSVNALLAPMSADLFARGDLAGLQRCLANGALLSTALGIVMAVALLISGSFLLHLFGPAFSRASSALAVLAAGQLFLAMCGSAFGMLAVAGRNQVLVIVMIAAIGFDVPLCLLLIPFLGQVGAALATSTATVVSGLCLSLAVRRLLGVDTTLRSGLLLLVEGRRKLSAVGDGAQ
jgi:O-antigen/teichoic acid export membrane protein